MKSKTKFTHKQHADYSAALEEISLGSLKSGAREKVRRSTKLSGFGVGLF